MQACVDLSYQTGRPVVRLLNAFERRRLKVRRLVVGYGVHRFPVLSWHFDDTVGFGLMPGDPEVYLFRELALEIEIEGRSVVLWLCDELNMQEPPACVCPIYGDEWSSAQRARLSLLFGGRVQEGDICPFLKVPERALTLWLNGYPLRA